MPPKAKYTREEITKAALDIVAERGVEALTARELGNVLGTSSRPIFTAFRSMEEVLNEVREAAFVLFGKHIKNIEDNSVPLFKQVGVSMVTFASTQPRLFRLLFMSEHSGSNTFDDVFNNLSDIAPKCIETIQFVYDLDYDNAMLLFRQVWIYTYGVGSLIATGMCRFEMNEIQSMLTNEFQAMLMLIKSGRAEKYTVVT